jgi:phosphatidylinositol-3-phosphatase
MVVQGIELAFCDTHILSFRPLPDDLARARTPPAFSFIVPNLCDDGHDAPCVTSAPGGLAQADAFLSRWVPKIMAAPAYRNGGLIVVAFDEGSDAAACCGETFGLSPDHPNVLDPGKYGPGGGRVGAVLLSPLIRPGTVSVLPVPGGPDSSTPRGICAPSLRYRPGSRRKSTISLTSF